MREPARQSDLSLLDKNFAKKFIPFWNEILKLYPHAVVFETLRSQERQNRLYGVGRTHSLDRKPVTRTLKSKHIEGKAVDIVFRNNGRIERAGPYDVLIEIAKKYGIKNLKPTETCHFEDDGSEIKIGYSKHDRDIAKEVVQFIRQKRDELESNEMQKEFNLLSIEFTRLSLRK